MPFATELAPKFAVAQATAAEPVQPRMPGWSDGIATPALQPMPSSDGSLHALSAPFQLETPMMAKMR